MRNISILLALMAAVFPLTSPAQESSAHQMYRVDSDNSWLRVLAYPDGPLRRFGHHHVIAHRNFSGTVNVAANPLESTFELEIAVSDLEVDDAEMRALEGEDFEDEVPQKDIDGTRANMLGEKLLNGEQFPTILIHSAGMQGELPDITIVTTLTVKGMQQEVSFPARVMLTEDTFVATGELEIEHAGLGLSPFTAMGGALSVRDLLVLKYEISGARQAAGN